VVEVIVGERQSRAAFLDTPRGHSYTAALSHRATSKFPEILEELLGMSKRASCVGAALILALAVAPALAQEAPPPPPPAAPAAIPATRTGPAPGRGSVGGLIGGSYFYLADEYSKGAQIRFNFAGMLRYVATPSWRLQVSPGFTWSAYSKNEPPPFVDIRHPEDLTKENYLAQLIPVSIQIQRTWGKLPWHHHVGVGPGVYRLWVENHRDVLVDPKTFREHQGLYWGFTVEAGTEHFVKSLPNTSVEVTLVNHYVLATRDDQFPHGWSSSVGALSLSAGVNYYFSLEPKKKATELPLPGTKR
jgi:hypothetical protein